MTKNQEKTLKKLKFGLSMDADQCPHFCTGFTSTDGKTWIGRLDITKKALEGVRDIMGYLAAQQMEQDPHNNAVDVTWDLPNGKTATLRLILEDSRTKEETDTVEQ